MPPRPGIADRTDRDLHPGRPRHHPGWSRRAATGAAGPSRLRPRPRHLAREHTGKHRIGPQPHPRSGTSQQHSHRPRRDHTVADLTISKTHIGTVRIGDPFQFTLTVTNDGPSTARHVHIDDPLPAGLTLIAAEGTGWTCTATGNATTCDLTDALPSGATANPIAITATPTSQAYPTVTNTATVAAATADPDLANNTASDTVAVPAQVDLGITKSHQPQPLHVGDPAIYTLTVTNNGPTDDPGPITVIDELPAGLTLHQRRRSRLDMHRQQPDSHLHPPGRVGRRRPSQHHHDDTVGAEAYPSLTNTATVASAAEDTEPANNTATDPADVLPLYHLVLVKTLDAITTSQADWTLTVTNQGPNRHRGRSSPT